MDKKLKRKWVKALRSGKFTQGTGMLRDKDQITGQSEFCCLGVLCFVARTRYNHNSGSLPEKFSAKAGVSVEAQDTLVVMNDEKLASFKRIATWIEKNL